MDEGRSTESRPVLRINRTMCGTSVSIKTFKAHRRLFYDAGSSKWVTLQSGEDSPVSGSMNVCEDDTPPSSFGNIPNSPVDTDNNPPSTDRE